MVKWQFNCWLIVGEKPLLNNEPHFSSVRARTVVKVLVMDESVFTQSFPALVSLCDTLAQTLNYRPMEPAKGGVQ
jgi:CRP-like cAMP-binding protein